MRPRSLFTAMRLSVAIVSAIVVLNLAAAPGVDAASAGPDLTFCLVYESGAPYASQPVWLAKWDGVKQVYYRTGRTAANGCGTFRSVHPNSWQRVVGYWSVLRPEAYYYLGSTVWTGVGAAGQYNAGTGVMSRYSFF